MAKRKRAVGENGKPRQSLEEMESSLQRWAETFNLEHKLAPVRAEALRILGQYEAELAVGWADGKPIYQRRSAAEWPHELPAFIEGMEKEAMLAQDASAIMHKLACLQDRLKANDPAYAALHALAIGALAMRIGVADDLLVGTTQRQRARELSRETHGSTEERQRKYLEWYREFCAVWPASTTKRGQAYRRIAKKYAPVHWTTVRDRILEIERAEKTSE